MAETTIEWTRGPAGELGYTFNGWIGCTKVSPGCENCYAAAQDKFRSWTPEGWGAGKQRRRTSAENWKHPQQWDKAAAAAGERRRVFCSSLADVFDNEVPLDWLVDLLDLVRRTPHLDWLLLTKRIGRVRAALDAAVRDVNVHQAGPELFAWLRAWTSGSPPHNVWLGATIVNQEEADRDIPKLLATPARVRFLSMEPLLGPVNLARIDINGHSEIFPLKGTTGCEDDDGSPLPDIPRIDWVIVGGESGPGARPMHPDWPSSLRDQCAAAGVPFLFKQWGEWAPAEIEPGGRIGDEMRSGRVQLLHAPGNPEGFFRRGDAFVRRLGKKAAGRLLDGRTHDGFPEVQHA
jgi:protein gp37